MRHIRRAFTNIVVLVGFCLLAGVIGAQAASLSVTNTADAGSGSLRQAIIDATTNAAANIVTINIPTSDPGYDPVENRFTIDLLTPLPDIPLAPLSISNNQPHEVTVNGNGTFRIFTLVNSAVLTIDNLSITNGFANNGLGGGIYMGDSSTMTLNGSIVSNNIAAANGGGIYMSNSGTLHLNHSNVRDNRAINGGGIFIFDSGTLNIDSSTINSNTSISGGNGGGIFNGTSGTINGTSNTIDGNSAANFGGGIYNTATITLTNNTISSNTAVVEGGGIYNAFTATLQNNLVALNTAATSNDLFGTYAGSYNLIGNADGSTGLGSAPNRSGTTANPLDPRLGPLQDNGGQTYTRALLFESPAIDKGNSATIITDQRGLPRPFDNPEIPNDAGNGSDIGAFEVQTVLGPDPTPSPTPTVEPSPTPTVEPSPTPTVEPSPTPTVEPSPTPTVEPSPTPTVEPSPTPTVEPSPTPTVEPSPTPTVEPSPTPTVAPSPTPTVEPSPTPTVEPSPTPIVVPSPTPTVSPSPTPIDGQWEGDINRADPNVPGLGDGNVDNVDLFWYTAFAEGRHCSSDGVGGEFQRMDGNDSGGIDAGDYTYIFSVWLGLLTKVAPKGTTARPVGLCDGVPAWPSESGKLVASMGGNALNATGITVATTSGQPGDQVLVPILVESDGTLDSMGFTITYDPAVLSISGVDGFGNPDVLAGPGKATNQVIGVNSTIGGMIVGIDFTGTANPVVPLPSGIRQVALLRFTINSSATVGTTTQVTITPRTTVDVTGNVIAGVTVASGTVTIAGSRSFVIGGRVVTESGAGIRGAVVTFTDSDGNRRKVTTSTLGYYEIAGVEAGQTYVVTAATKRSRFQARTITVHDSLRDVDFVGIE